MLRQPPPQWLLRWRQVLLMLLNLEITTIRMMSRMVRLGMAQRSWLSLRETVALRQEQEMLVQAMNQPHYHPSECTHPDWKRYGNRTGSYARCTLCHTRRRWDHQERVWVEIGPVPSASSSLPQPSPSNTSQALPRSLRTTTSKAKAKSRAYPSSPSPSSDPFAQQVPLHVLQDLSRVTEANLPQIHLEQMQRLMQMAEEDGSPQMDWQETASQLDLYEWDEGGDL